MDAASRQRTDVRLLVRALSFLTLAILACFLAVTRADTDLWGHLRFGRDIVDAGWAVHQSDPYSFTSDRPWINHEWLAEGFLWMSYRLGGVSGLVALKVLAACAVGAFVLETWRDKRLTLMWRDGLLLALTLGVWPLFATMRPQLFSAVLFAAELFVLERVRRGDRGWLPALVGLFAAWVNFHGGWLVGAGIFAVFAACSLLDSTLEWRHRAEIVLAALASMSATLCNPYGRQMLAFLFETVRPDRADIPEWAPVTSLPPIAFALWVIPTLLAAIAICRNRRAIPVSSIAVSLVLSIGAFQVARLIGFYTLAVGMLLAPHAATAGFSEIEVRRRLPFQRAGRAVAATFVLVCLATALFGRRISIDGVAFPEPEAASFVRSNHLHGRMLTFFDYGEYAIWHFWPDLRVSMDGRRETVYTARTIERHLAFYRGDAPEYARELQADYVWLPRSAPAVAALEANGWQSIFSGPVSTILAARSSGFVPAPHNVQVAKAEFPGP
jgi:hypothetical protein